MHLAAYCGHDGVTRLLLAMPNVNPNYKDSYRQGPLMRTIKQGNKSTINLLLAQDGIDPMCRGQRGLAPLLR